MSEYIKSDLCNDHEIESTNVLLEKETGRVVAVFYNDYDLNDVLSQLNESSPVAIEKLESIAEAAEIITQNYWKYINEDTAKENLRLAILDYKGWVKSNE